MHDCPIDRTLRVLYIGHMARAITPGRKVQMTTIAVTNKTEMAVLQDALMAVERADSKDALLLEAAGMKQLAATYRDRAVAARALLSKLYGE